MTNTKKKELPPRHLILRLRLDSRQVTQALRYSVYTLDGEPCDFETMGPYAGTFNFRKGDDIQIEVQATLHKYKNYFPDFSVINGSIMCITSPASAGENPNLSPFDPNNACTSISAWSEQEDIPKSKVFSKEELSLMDKGEKIKCVQVKALKSIIVGVNKGRWQMSGYLSTLYYVDGKQYSRLYFFDPEGSAGTGAGLGSGGGPP